MTYTIKLHGDVPSKKNSKRRVQRGRNIFMIPSEAHERWHAEQYPSLMRCNLKGVTSAKITITFCPSTKRRADLSNKAESVMDLLVDCGIIRDDDWFTVADLHLKRGEISKEDPHAFIELTDYEVEKS